VDADDQGPPYTAVIFTNQRTGADSEGYMATAARMEALAREQPGYRGLESVRADDAGITVSYWTTEADARAWKQQSEHLAAQAAGRDEWYSSYRVRIATVEREYSYHRAHGSHSEHTDPS
jgi:heme-degrading monooxygenase HmoA